MKKTTITFFIVIILIIVISIIVFMNIDSKKSAEEKIVESTFEESLDKDGVVPENWKNYSSDSMGFSMYYDPSLIIKEDTKNDVRFYKYGPTQKGQTEMYDGIILSVLKVSVVDGGQPYIDTQMEQYKDVGKITEPLHDGNLNGISVKEYSASGLGDFKIIFVPIDRQTLLEISYMAPDPTNVGFQKTIDLMLSTFNLK